MKVIGSDFDGTIPTNKIILKSTREKIKKFRDEGNVFIIVTGRSITKFKEGIKKYNINFFDYVICANGSIVLDQNLNIIAKKMMKRTEIETALNVLFHDSHMKIILNTLNESYPVQKIEDYLDIKNPVLSISITFKSIEERKKYSFDKLRNLSIFSNGLYTDVSANHVSKSNALFELFSNINGNELYTIGDGENDICMLEMSHRSYTFNSSVDCVKKSATFICGSIDEILDKINND